MARTNTEKLSDVQQDAKGALSDLVRLLARQAAREHFAASNASASGRHSQEASKDADYDVAA